MLMLAYDTETQGLPLFDQPSDDLRQPHIVEIAAGLYDLATGERVETLHHVIKPDGWTIPDEVAKIHGITTERALADGAPEAEVIEAFDRLWRRADIAFRCAHNEPFDARIMRIAYKRFVGAAEADTWKAGKAVCTAKLATQLCKLPPTNRMLAAGFKKYKTPNLTECMRHFFGEAHDDAHGALADMRACARVYFAVRALGNTASAGAVTAAVPLTIPPTPAATVARDEVPFL